MRPFRPRRPRLPDAAGYRFTVSFLLFATIVSQTALSQESNPKLRVARLIDRLGSSSYARRQTAGRELLELGQPTIGPLEAAATGEDPEVRIRAEKLLSEIKTRRLWAGSTVKRTGSSRMASAILKDAARTSGNRLVFGGRFDNFVDREINVQAGRVPFWKVVDDVCRQTENRLSMRRQAETGAMVIVAGKPGNYPVAYAGPMRVHLSQAKRQFSESLDYEDGTSALTHTFTIDMAANWETRCQLLAYRSDAEIVEAISDKGQRLWAAPGSYGGWNVVPTGAGQIETTLRLQPPSVKASKLKKLHIRWEFVAAGDPQTIEITDFETPRVYRSHDVELVFDRLEKQSDIRYEVTLVTSRSALIPELQDLSQIENKIVLVDDSGAKMTLHTRTVQDAELSRRKTPFLTEGVRMTFAFLASSADRKPAKLRFTYPRIRSRKKLDVIFRDVQLPSTAPD